VDPEELDEVVTSWARTGIEQKANRNDDDDEKGTLSGIAVDGKALRGSRQSDGTRIHLLSALDHDSKTIISQKDVPLDKTNEITIFEPLISALKITGKVITADAMHTQVKTARSIVEDKRAHYVFGVKANQPLLYNAGIELLETIDLDTADFERVQRGHGRIDRHRIWVKDVPEEIKFPYAKQFVLVERESSDLNDCMKSLETRIYVTDLIKTDATAESLFRLISSHWSIEANHWIRDVVFNEDLSQIRKG
ncbi:transposase for IS2404, partial [mine drainage metagenome]